MQRLHEDDLAGRLLEKGGWPHLKIPAVAEQGERIPIGPGRIYRRKAGTVIDPRRESLEDLERLKQQMTELSFRRSISSSRYPLPATSSRPSGSRNTRSLQLIAITIF